VRIGIVGLHLSGKSTVFNALTRGTARTGLFSAVREEVHVSIVEVPDDRVEVLVRLLHPNKVTLAKIEYVDVVGVGRGSARTADTATGFLAPVRQADALLHVARAFVDDSVPHPLGSVDALRDVTALEEEFIIADLIAAEKRLEKIAKLAALGKKPEQKGEAEVLEKCREHLCREAPLRDAQFSLEEEKIIRGFQFLSRKPVLVILNAGEESDPCAIQEIARCLAARKQSVVALCGKLEMEIAACSPEDAAELMEVAGLSEGASRKVVRASCALLDLITFYTPAHAELTAWLLRRGSHIVEAAGQIHTDMARGFIKAEVIAFNDLVACESFAHAREKGLLRVEGKGYEVKDGDVITIRFAA
jgi:GTP-binding protein YchF